MIKYSYEPANSWWVRLITLSKVKYQPQPDLTVLRLIVSSHATWCWVAGEMPNYYSHSDPYGRVVDQQFILAYMVPVLRKQNHRRA